MIPIRFVQRHASVFSVIITIVIIRIFMAGMALWLQVLAAMILSVVVSVMLYKRGVTPRRRKGSLFRTLVDDPAEPFR